MPPPRVRKAPTSRPPALVRRAKVIAAASRDAEQDRWRSENAQAIEEYNAFVERHGVFGDELRQF